MSEKLLAERAVCARRLGTGRSFSLWGTSGATRRTTLGKSFGKNGSRAYSCGDWEARMEIPVYRRMVKNLSGVLGGKITTFQIWYAPRHYLASHGPRGAMLKWTPPTGHFWRSK